MREEATVETIWQLRKVVDNVTFAKSCVNLDWKWVIWPIFDGGESGLDVGWLVSTTFSRPDRDTGELQRGEGRREFIAKGTSESGVVKTCWLLAELIVRHEIMEAFHYKGMRVFDPHHTVYELGGIRGPVAD